MKKMMKSKSKKLAKANYGMAVTDDKYAKLKTKYPNKEKEFIAIENKEKKRDQAFADAAIARANMAKKKATPVVTQKTGGNMYKKGGPVKKKKK
jgi:hypothetical protein